MSDVIKWMVTFGLDVFLLCLSTTQPVYGRCPEKWERLATVVYGRCSDRSRVVAVTRQRNTDAYQRAGEHAKACGWQRKDEGGAKSHVMMDEDREDLVALNTFTSVIPESRRQANLDAYVSWWLRVLRMKRSYERGIVIGGIRTSMA